MCGCGGNKAKSGTPYSSPNAARAERQAAAAAASKRLGIQSPAPAAVKPPPARQEG